MKESGPTIGWLIKVALLDLIAALVLYLYDRSAGWGSLHPYGAAHSTSESRCRLSVCSL